jgi:four helix bundle protein
MRSHKDLDVWKEAMQLVKGVYRLSATLPREETYGLVAQMRRAAISVPSNIAEGAARDSLREFVQFLYVSLGSLAELETQLILAKEIFGCDTSSLEDTINRLRRMLIGLIKSLRKRGEGGENLVQ